MKKIIRLTERDLTRLVKRVIKEQLVSDPTKDPIQKPFWEYATDRWGKNIDPYASIEIEEDKNGNTVLCDGPCKGMIPGTDTNTITWDYKKGMVLATKSFGIDPKPISIKTNFEQMRQWFDNTFGRSSQKTTTSGGHPDGL